MEVDEQMLKLVISYRPHEYSTEKSHETNSCFPLLFLSMLDLRPVLPLYEKGKSSPIKHPLSFFTPLQNLNFAAVGRLFFSWWENLNGYIHGETCAMDILTWVKYNLNIIAYS